MRDRYSAFGRPSIDPVVFFKLQLVMFFEGIRSERQLEHVGSDRLRVRWYLGYDLTEALPDHSSMTRIRDRYGIPVFRRFFEALVAHCQDDGLIWGRELFADATLVEANADRDKMLPRFAVEAHLQQLFGGDAFSYDAEADHYTCPTGAILRWERHDYVNHPHHYRADAASCTACSQKAKCTKSDDGRTHRRSFFQEYLDRVAAYQQTKAYKKAYQKRKVWVPAKRYH